MLYGLRSGLQPKPFFGSETRRECAEDPCVVAVEPLALFRGEQFCDDGGSVDVAAGQRVEAEPFSELVNVCSPFLMPAAACAACRFVFYRQNDVLMPDSVQALAVDARLV